MEEKKDDLRPEADLIWAGGGTLFDALAGAGERVEKSFRPRRVGGTSAGSFVAAGRAFGLDWETMKELNKRALASKKLVDVSLKPWERWGFVKGDYLHGLLREYLPGKMGDAELPWCCYAVDLWRTKLGRMSSWETPDVLAADALRASSAIPGFFKGIRVPYAIPLVGGGFADSGGPRFMVDGGLGSNFAMDSFDDDESVPTIGIRFRPTGKKNAEEQEITVTDLLWPPRAMKKAAAYARAVTELAIQNGVEAHMSEKNWQREIRIDADGESGMNFELTELEVERRWAFGYESADEQLPRVTTSVTV